MPTPVQVVKSFPALADVLRQKRAKDAAFLILLITNFDVIVSSKGGRTLKINLSVDLPVLRTTKEKQLFQQACAHDKVATEFVAGLEETGLHRYAGPFPFRWASGGYLPIFVIDGVRYCMLFLRDLAPVVGWNLATGASESPVELWHVELMVEREPKEEILVINRAGQKEFCYRLESPGGSVQTVDHHKKVLKLLGKNIPIEMQPLVGKVVADAPDKIEVSAPWASKYCPHVTTNGFVILNPENGENGIEFIQIVEWEIRERLVNLVFLDAELHEKSELDDGKTIGAPIQQAVGLFPFDELIHEFQKPEPQPMPKYVFDKGNLLSGDILKEWLRDRPHSKKWCPVVRRVLRRYIGHAFGVCNSLVQTSEDTWTITFEGKSINLKHRAGLTYLAHLLKHPGKLITCAELSSLTHPRESDSSLDGRSEAQLENEEHLSITETQLTQELLDPRAKREIRARLENLNNDLKNTDAELAKAKHFQHPALIEQLTNARDLLLDEVARILGQRDEDSGPYGKSRKYPGSWEERMRGAVSKAISRSLVAIKEQDEHLWQHLNDSIHTGRECMYSPPPLTSWTF